MGVGGEAGNISHGKKGKPHPGLKEFLVDGEKHFARGAYLKAANAYSQRVPGSGKVGVLSIEQAVVFVLTGLLVFTLINGTMGQALEVNPRLAEAYLGRARCFLEREQHRVPHRTVICLTETPKMFPRGPRVFRKCARPSYDAVAASLTRSTSQASL
eukprot:1176224-Prorocentrum_minimum.AAC.2